MKNLDSATINVKLDIRSVMLLLEENSLKIALVTDDDNHFVGTITDGDIRRGLLAGMTLESPISGIVNRNPKVCHINDSKEHILSVAIGSSLQQIPIVDGDGVLMGLELVEDLIKQQTKDNPVIIMAGGLGTRLGKLTRTTPKPMLHVGKKPILMTIMESFAKYGFTNMILCVNYKARVIEDYFGDGSRFGLRIRYIRESQRMGTAGALSLLEPLEVPFFVMNGDILTNVNFENLLAFHLEAKAPATMSVRLYDVEVPYGVVLIKDNRIGGINEKPVHQFFVNAGIYVLNPDCLELIPKGQRFDMPTLFQSLVDQGRRPATYLISDYWIDIGHRKDFDTANDDFSHVF